MEKLVDQFSSVKVSSTSLLPGSTFTMFRYFGIIAEAHYIWSSMCPNEINLTLTGKVQKKFILKILTPSYLDII